jgi:ribosomal protein S18 acetylase RimI-like enzyme
MAGVQVRAFRREDREQLTRLVNAHVQAVVPGVSVSVNTVLRQLEREPGEFIVDPWVVARATLVAEQRGRIVAAAHLLRYGDGEDTGEHYRGVGELRWLLCWPEEPFWPDSAAAGAAVAAAAVANLTRSGATRLYADGALPAPGVYGIPEQWPHVRALLADAGFSEQPERTELVFLADVDRLARPAAPLDGLVARRALGANGTRISAVLRAEVVGYIEVDTGVGEQGTVARREGWADVGNLCVAASHRRRGIGAWLLGQAAEWLRLGHVDRLLDYSAPGEEAYVAFLRRAGFVELTRTSRAWTRA